MLIKAVTKYFKKQHVGLHISGNKFHNFHLIFISYLERKPDAEMITRVKLTRYLITVLKTAQRNIVKFNENGDAQTLHRLRVCHKKIKALTMLFNDYPGEAAAVPVTFGMLKPLNKAAARVRRLDIIMEMLKEHHKSRTALIKKCNRQRNLLAGKLIRKQTNLHSIQLLNFQKLITSYLDSISDSLVTERCRSIISRINRDILPALDNKTHRLHRARKDLKALIYIHEIIPPKINKGLHLNLKYLERAQHIIGQWHDCVDALEFVKENKTKNNDFRKSIAIRQKKKLKELKKLIKVNQVFN